jgi:transposase-like protein
MARRGRKPLATRHVDSLCGSDRAKLRLQVILQTLQGQMTVPQACQVLGICQSRFHALRNRWLQESLELLEPRPLGRPAQVVSPEQEQLAQLQAENRDLRQQRQVAEVRQELAQRLPHVLRPAGEGLKKGGRRSASIACTDRPNGTGDG